MNSQVWSLAIMSVWTDSLICGNFLYVHFGFREKPIIYTWVVIY